MLYELRPYQKESVEALRVNIRNGVRQQVLCSPTGSGKTEIAMHIVEEAAKKGSRVYFVCDRQTLVNQTSERFAENGIEHGVLMGNSSKRLWSNILVCSSQTLESRGFKWKRTSWEWEEEQEVAKDPDLVILDECFPGNVEILTEKGFCRFDCLQKSLKVAQWNKGHIDFVLPEKHIRKNYSGEMCHLESRRRINVCMTPEHQMVFRMKSSGKIRKESAIEARLNSNRDIPCAGFAVGNNLPLSSLERLYIALQADGNMHYRRKKDGLVTVAFSLKKERKINRLREILRRGGFRFREESREKGVIRFFIYDLPKETSKQVWKHFSLTDMNWQRARDILNEMYRWDGSTTMGSLSYFSSTDELTTDFYQAVATLAGFRSRKTQQEDNRSTKFSTVYRLFISQKKDHISAQGIHKNFFPWDGQVYCVKVPSGNIVIRSSGQTLVIGNCHEIRKKIVEYLRKNNILTIGLSATPFTSGLKKYYDAVVNVTTTQQLVTEGYLSPLKIMAAKAEVDVEGLKVGSLGEWDKGQMSDRVMQITGEVVPEWEKHTKEHFGGPVPTIVFCPSVADSEDFAQKFQENGYDFRVVSYKNSSEEKQERVNNFKKGNHLGLISCVALTKGFDAPYTQCMIDAYPLRKSFSMHVQKVGRVMRIAKGKSFGLVIDMAGNWLGFYDQTHAFFQAGCHELEDEKIKKAKRQKKERTEHLKCRECGYIFSPDQQRLDTCPACGAARRRPRGKLLSVDGVLSQVDAIDAKGRKLPYNGDWWPELCAISLKIAKGDTDKAKKIAYAKYKSIFGHWPKSDFQFVDREPNPKVAKYDYKQWLRYKTAQRKIAGR